jgi:hypothetical protein
MNPLVAQLEEKLLPEFRKIADRINQTIPSVTARASSYSVGYDEYLSHSIGISCLLQNVDEPDNIALGVNIFRLNTTPKINADVCWGHPSGHIEAETFTDWTKSDDLPDVSEEVLENLYKNLPRLYEALFKALKRRKPGDE